jgi:RNA polymerase sigma factor (sigma-70 family)
MDDVSDKALVALARGGNHQAFAVLLGRHQAVLLALCRHALGDALLAEDAMQEASLQAFLNLDRLRDATQFGPWLYGIGLNMCRRILRMRSQDAWSWEAMVGGSYIDEPISLRPGPSELAEAADLRARVLHAVSALPPGQRSAVMLFYLSGLSHAETAQILGITVGSIKTRLHKARASLRESLWPVWKEESMEEEVATNLVEMRVADVWQPPRNGDKPRSTVIVLKELDGPGHVIMWIGAFEGEALAVALEKKEMPRPMTYAFAANLLQAAGGRLREVRISQLVEITYYAEVVIESPNGTHSVDARPSDALNLAMLVGVPIRVSSTLISQSKEWIERMRQAHATGELTEWTSPLDVIDHIEKMITSEATGGAAEIVARLP